MEENFEKRLEALPYPAVILPIKGKRLYRNRLARRLLPPAARLRELLTASRLESDDVLKEMRLDSVAYLLISLALEDGDTAFFFFEHFLPLQEALSRALVLRMKDFLWALLEKEHEAHSQNAVYLDQIAARACALRSHGDDYLRLLDASDLLFAEEAQSCSLDGFFGHLKRALDVRGIQTSFSFPKGSTVLSEGAVLSYLVLNLVHFVRLFEGERRVKVSVQSRANGLRFSVNFPDDGAVVSSLEELICRGGVHEKLLHILPMLCILRVCMAKGIPWSVSRKGNRLSFSFILAKGIEKPVLFLSDAAAEEIARLLQMIKTFFS